MLMTKEEIAEEHVQEVERELRNADLLVDELEDYLDYRIRDVMKAGRYDEALAYIDVKGELYFRRGYYAGR